MDNTSQKTNSIWLQMLQEYLVDPAVSYNKLSEKYGISTRSIEKHGSAEGWPRMRAEVHLKAIERIKEKAINEVTRYRKKMIDSGQIMSGKALKRLTKDDVEPENPRDVLPYLVEGLKLEGIALGFSFSKPEINLNNLINIQQNSYNPNFRWTGDIPYKPQTMTWANGEPLPPYRKPIETKEEEEAWLKEQEAKGQSQSSQTA